MHPWCNDTIFFFVILYIDDFCTHVLFKENICILIYLLAKTDFSLAYRKKSSTAFRRTLAYWFKIEVAWFQKEKFRLATWNSAFLEWKYRILSFKVHLGLLTHQCVLILIGVSPRDMHVVWIGGKNAILRPQEKFTLKESRYILLTIKSLMK